MDFINKNGLIKLIGFFSIFFIFIFGTFHFSKQIHPKSRYPITDLKNNIQFKNPGEKNWKPFSIDTYIRPDRNQNLIHLRIQLPEFHSGQNAIYIEMIDIAARIYFEDQIIYTHGEWNDQGKVPLFPSFFSHLFLVPNEASGKVLDLDVYADWKTIGIHSGIHLGNESDLRDYYFLDQLFNFTFSFFYFVVGISALLIYWLAKDKSLFYFALSSLSLSVICLAEVNINLTAYHFHEFSAFLGLNAFFLLVFSFIQFLRIIFPNTLRKIMDIYLTGVVLFYFYSIFVIVVYGFTREYCERFEVQGGVFSGIGCILALVIAIKRVFEKDINARILLFGLLIFSSTFSQYLLFQFGASETNSNDIHLRFFPVMMSLVWMIAIRYKDNINRLQETTFLLELSKENLEEKVREKTISLEVANEKLSKEIKTKSDFFANISHEFKTPLSLILSPSEKLAQYTKDKESLFLLSIIHRNSRRIETLVNDLLTMAKIEFGVFTKEESDVEVASYFKKIAEEFELLCDEKKILFKYQENPEKIYLKIQKENWDLILRNLLSNAVKFTRFGQVELSYYLLENSIEINIIDTGIGIKKEELPLIFDRFFQSERNKESSAFGTGIGLYLVKEMVKNCGGSILINSEIDVGTNVKLNLPMTRLNLQNGHISEEVNFSFEKYRLSNVLETNQEIYHVIIIEDEPSMAEYLEYLLKDEFKTSKYSSIESAIAEIEYSEIDLILSDWTLPGKNGIALLREVREKNINIPFLFLTARSEETIIEQAFSMGADDFIKKPFIASDLVARIHQKISKHKDHTRSILAEIDKVYGDIHDILGGKLTELMLQINLMKSEESIPIKSIESILDTANSLSKELRNRLQEWEDLRNMENDFQLGWMSLVLRRYNNVGRSCRIKIIEPADWKDAEKWNKEFKMEIYKITQEFINNDMKYGTGTAYFRIKSFYPSFDLTIKTKSNFQESTTKGRGSRNLNESSQRLGAELRYSKNQDDFFIHLFVPKVNYKAKILQNHTNRVFPS